MDKIKLLIADDHSIIKEGIRLMLNNDTDIEIVHEASSGEEVIAYVENNSEKVDVLLTDINMAKKNGIETTKIITEQFNHIKVLALTMNAEKSYITQMIEAGALGYILKESDSNELKKAIKTVAAGNKYYSQSVSNTMIDAFLNNEQSNELSEREIDVLRQIANGATNKEAGENLFISPRTVESHRRSILEKLELRNTADMVRYAIKNNYIN